MSKSFSAPTPPPSPTPSWFSRFMLALHDRLHRAAHPLTAFFFVFCVLLSLTSSVPAQTQQAVDPSVKAYDNFFKTLKPGQTVAYIGDMGFKVETLKAFRDYLAAQSGSSTIGSRGAFDWDRNLTWTNRRVPYIFDSSVSQAHQRIFRDGIFAIQQIANVRWETKQATDTDYVRVVFQPDKPDGSAGGMDSFIGRLGTGQQILNIDSSIDSTKGFVRCAHEVGHCIGMIHEQCRPDRDTYITITSATAGFDPLGNVNWAKVPSSTYGSTYDYDSLMHYGRDDCTDDVNGNRVCADIRAKSPNERWSDGDKTNGEIGQEDHVSTGDATSLISQFGTSFSIRGKVSLGTTGVFGVTITGVGINGSAYHGPTVTTASDGTYTLPGVTTGTYKVTASRSGSYFNPKSIDVTVSTVSVNNINFTSVAALERSPATLLFSNTWPNTSAATSSKNFTVKNIGATGTTLNWSATDNATWLTLSPASGTSTGEADTVTAAVNMSGLPQGNNTATITITDPNASFSPQTITVTASVPVIGSYVFTGKANICIGGGGGGCSDFIPGDPNDWFDHRNWSPEGIPGKNDIATISGSTFNVHLNNGGGMVTVAGLNLIAGSLRGNFLKFNTANPSPQFNWEGGSLYSLVVDIPASGIFAMSESLKYFDGTIINNSGLTTWSGVGKVMCGNGAVFNNLLGGTFRIVSDGDVFDLFNSPKNLTFTNSGLFTRASTTNGTNSLRGLHRFTNNPTGVIDIQTGIVALDFAAEGLVLESGCKIVGDGVLQMLTGPTNLKGTLNLTTTPRSGGGMSGAGTFNFGGSILTATNNVAAPATITGAGRFLWTAGTLFESLTVALGATMDITGPQTKAMWDGAVLINKGTINWSGPGQIQTRQRDTAATINNESGAVFNLTTDGVTFRNEYQVIGDASTFHNKLNAKLIKSGGTGTTTFSAFALNNSGTVQVNSGTLALAGTVSATTGSPITLNNGGTFAGPGTVLISDHTILTGTLNNSASLFWMGGTLTANGATYNGSTPLNWQGGHLVGNLTIAFAKTLNISDPPSGPTTKVLWDGTVLTNKGTINWSGPGQIQTRQRDVAAAINNESTGVFNLTTDGVIFRNEYQITGNASTFHNKLNAKLIKSGGAGTTTFSAFALNNSGTVQVNSGTLALAGATAATTGSPITLNHGGTFAGPGTVSISDNTVFTGTHSSSTSVYYLGGTLTGTGAVYSGTGPLHWQGGWLAGDLTVAVGAKLNISDPTTGPTSKWFSNSAVLNNKGTTTWSGVGTIRAWMRDGSATINNQSNATFNLSNDGTVFSQEYSGTPVFNNLANASFHKTAGTGTSSLAAWSFRNAGTIVAHTGVLEMGAALQLNNGGTIMGLGKTITQGAATLAGTTTINGTIFELSGGYLTGHADGSGTIAGARFDWTGGAIGNTVSFALGSNIYFTGAGLKVLRDGAVINNQGVVNFTLGTLNANNDYAPSTFNNLDNATFNVAGGLVIGYNQGHGLISTFNNAGTMNLDPIGGAVNMGWKFAQSGAGTLQTTLNSATTYGRMTVTDPFNAGGAVTLSGALKVQLLGSYNPSVDTSFNIINPPAAATGTFSGLPQNATLMVGTRAFNISYSGGDGNDVVLTHLPTVSVTGPTTAITEGNSGNVNAAFVVRLSTASTQQVTINFAARNDTAAAGTDFTATTGTLTFAPNELTKTVIVPVLGDLQDEENETFKLRLSSPTNATLTVTEASATITDDDALPSLVVTNPRAFKEGSAAAPGSTTLSVLLSAPSGKQVKVNFATANGVVNGAIAGTDYVAKSGTLIFEPGQTRKSVIVNFIGEAIAELNEPFFLDIKTPVNATIVDSRGAAYIQNDDGPVITIDNAVSVPEGSTISQTTPQNFVVKLSAASPNTITVDWLTGNGPQGTGAGPADYTVANGRLTFAPGEISKTITILVKQDTTVETTETYRVNLTRPTFATIGDSQGIGYILNDDVAASSFVNSHEPSQ